MKKVLLLTSLLFSIQSEAAIVSVTGDGAQIAPTVVNEDSPTNSIQHGFDENQGVLLTSALDVDGGSIAANTYVNSHLIFLNTQGNTSANTNATWTFDGDILGVMSQGNGQQIVDSNNLFAVGDYFSVGSSAPFNLLGLESNDGYSISGDELVLAMRVSEPGDWIRVVTAAEVSAVPLPASAFLFGPAVLGFIARRRIKK